MIEDINKPTVEQSALTPPPMPTDTSKFILELRDSYTQMLNYNKQLLDSYLGISGGLNVTYNQLFDSLSNLKNKVDNISSSINTLTTTKDVEEFIKQLNELFTKGLDKESIKDLFGSEQIFDILKEELDIVNELAQTYKDQGIETFRKFIPSINNFFDQFKSIVEKMPAMITPEVGYNLNKIDNQLKAFNTTVKNAPFKSVLETVGSGIFGIEKAVVKAAGGMDLLKIALNVLAGSIKNIWSVITTHTSAVLGLGFWTLIKAAFAGIATLSNNVASLGSVFFALKDPINFARLAGMHFATSMAFLGRNLDEILNITGQAYKVGLISTRELGNKMSDSFVLNVAKMANTWDQFGRQMGLSFETFSAELMAMIGIFHNSLTGGVEKVFTDTAQTFMAINKQLMSNFFMTFQEFRTIFSNVFSNTLFLGRTAGKQMYENLVGMTAQIVSTFQTIAGQIKTIDQIVGNQFSFTKDHIITIFKEMNSAIGKTSWEMYYGILAMTGKLSTNLDASIAQALRADPFARFLSVIQMFKDTLGTELPTTFAAFIPGLEGLREYPGLVEKISVAFTNLKGQMDFSKEGSIAEFFKQAGLTADETLKLRQQMEVFGDPLKTLVNLVTKILNLLQSTLGRFASIGLSAVKLGGFK